MDDNLHTGSYAHSQSRETSSHHHTSSAFSASAQPDEDWTKISDLAERRRIQNRIAQRNYRMSSTSSPALVGLRADPHAGKKLKRRLEDLERKAASTSPSPEQEPRELPAKSTKSKSHHGAANKKRNASPQQSQQHKVQQTSASDDWTLFSSDMHSRQTTTSPPPFLYSTMESSQTPPSPQLPGGIFAPMPDSFYQFPRPLEDLSTQYMWQDKAFATKQENPLENDMTPLYLSTFTPSYANSANVDMSFSAPFGEQCLTPELCDVYDYSSADSSSDFGACTFPPTPLIMPLTPPYHAFDSFEQS